MPFTCNTSKWAAVQPPSYNPDTYCSPLPYFIPDLKNMLAGLRDSIDPMIQASLGLCGVPMYLDGALNTSLAGYYYCAIVVIRDTILNVTAGNTNEIDGTGADISLAALSGATLPAGTVLNGTFKKVVVTSGHVKLLPHPFLNP